MPRAIRGRSVTPRAIMPDCSSDPLADRMTLVVVAVEHRVVGAGERRVDFPREVRGVLDAGVHALTAHRRVHVRRVAGQEHPAMPILLDLPFVAMESGLPTHLEQPEIGLHRPRQDAGDFVADPPARCRTPGACGPTPSCGTTNRPRRDGRRGPGTRTRCECCPASGRRRSGPCASLTSASTIDDKIVLPGKSTPSNARTVLCAPSAPIKYFARQRSVMARRRTGRAVTVTPSASCSSPTTSMPRRISAPCATA